MPLNRIDSMLSPFALFHPRELSVLFASTAYNGRAQENLSVTASAQDRRVSHTSLLRQGLCNSQLFFQDFSNLV
jgi:hypothetical protein